MLFRIEVAVIDHARLLFVKYLLAIVFVVYWFFFI